MLIDWLGWILGARDQGRRKVRYMQEAGTTPAAHELAHYIGPLRRHRVFVAMCLVVGLALGVFASLATKPSYTSTVRVLVLADITDQGTGNAATSRTTGAVNMDTEAQVIKSEPVAALVQSQLKSSATPAQLTSRLGVTVPANTTVLAVTYKAGSAAAAQAGATAFATAYLDNRTSFAQDAIKAQIASVDKQISAAEDSLKKLTVTVNNAQAGTPDKNYALKQESRLQTQINSLNPLVNTLTTAVVNPGRVISPASPGVKEVLNAEIVLISGALLGLLIGLVGAIMRERMSRVVRSPADLEDLGIRTLGWDDGKATDDGRARRRIMRRRTPQHQVAAVISAALNQGGTVYVATISSAPSAPRIAGQLSHDLRRFGGTATVIPVEQATSGKYAPDQPHSKVHSTRGTGAPLGWPNGMPEHRSGRARLTATSLRDLIDSDRVKADYVIVEGHEAGRDSEAFLVASLADASLLVIQPGVTRRADLRLVVEEIRLTSSHLIGAVFVTSKHTATADEPIEQALTPPPPERGGPSQRRPKPGSTRGTGSRSSVTAGDRVLERPPAGRE
jgi:capsular polysaccharide biosynthesis protein